MSDRHHVSATYIGRTKVHGMDYLPENLAMSLLNRQLEKKTKSTRAKFTDSYIHLSGSDDRHHSRYEDEIPYDAIRKVYTFYQKPDVLMVCADENYSDMKIYSSFRFNHESDVKRARKYITGGYYESRSRRSDSYTVAARPRRTSIVQYENERPATTTFYEPTQYRVVSRVYRPPSRSPSPIYVEQTKTTTPVVERVQTIPVVERVVSERTPSPIYIQSVPTVERTVPTYTETAPVEPVVYKRVTRPESTVRTTYVTQPATNYVEAPVYPRSGGTISRATSKFYYNDEMADSDVVLKRISRIPPTGYK